MACVSPDQLRLRIVDLNNQHADLLHRAEEIASVAAVHSKQFTHELQTIRHTALKMDESGTITEVDLLLSQQPSIKPNLRQQVVGDN
ncbi:hypothetical protein PAPYR_2154 [Paratrimastix pyriformis]|uniref:Uncharacterized protein n=1 Tax=Paratrimastix pyriformis TaxID=342808 RepID=A0ABQ8UQX9_9EUKA|nr:hypothetical protein PAPYR_2154 [Paratrimastix pyriformis]